MVMPGAWTYRLHGSVELRDPNGVRVPLPTRKTALLLAMLALDAGAWQTRAELALAVWEGTDLRRAREGMRTALSALRKMLPEDAIFCEGEKLALQPSIVLVPQVRVDDGDFMPGFDNDWAIDRRLSLRAERVALCLRSARTCLSEGRHESALSETERACRLDPLDSEADDLRTKVLTDLGRHTEATARSAAYRVRVTRELGISPEAKPLRRAEDSLFEAVEWALARDPEEACALVAATDGPWLGVSLERALDIHRRVLSATLRPSPTRTIVESRAALFDAMIDPTSILTGKLEDLYREARTKGVPSVLASLCEALTYGFLSAGRFDKARAYVKEGAETAQRRGDAADIARWSLHRGFIEFHTGNSETSVRHIDSAVVAAERSGSTRTILDAHGARIGFAIHRGRLDQASKLLVHHRPRVSAYASERMDVWMAEIEGLLYERAGDLEKAREAYALFRALAPAGGQCAVAMADDSLMRVECGLREFDRATDALARNAVYRRRKGSVPSAFEKAANAPSVRMIRERVGERDLRLALRRAAFSIDP